MNSIFAREYELSVLESIYRSSEAEFLAIYGRRRIGKTYLINNFFKDKGIYFELTGIKDAKLPEQLRNFSIEYADLFNQGNLEFVPKSWQEAFNKLRIQLQQVDSEQKVILFFDELPWLASARSNFLSALDHLWNRYLSRDKRIILIVCGSAASWMIKKIINNKAGLYGRLTRELKLLPFTLVESEKYLHSKEIVFDRKQIIELYMVLGGVAKYLTYVERGKSVAQIINETCFSVQGPLHAEFHKLYHSLFDGADYHIQIVKQLARKPSGMEQNDLLMSVGLTSGGRATDILDELQASGFIISLPIFSTKRKGKVYKLIDEYSLFFMAWVNDSPKLEFTEVDKDYWLKKYNSKKWNIWSGYAFEGICFKHIANIKKALGLAAVSTQEYAWRKTGDKSDGQGAQIDLVIDREDNCVNLCEMKFYNKEFSVNKLYADSLLSKKEIFRESTGTKKTLFTTFITTYGVKQNPYYFRSVDSQLTLDDLF